MASQGIDMSILDGEKGVRASQRGANERCEEPGEGPGKRVNPIIAALNRARQTKIDEITERKKLNDVSMKKSGNRYQRIYKRECIVKLSVLEKEKINVDDLISTIEEICGRGSLMACVPNGNNFFEVTLAEENHARVLVPSFMVDEIEVSAKQVYESTVNVSFMNMSTRIPNSAIENKLKQFGVELISPISERFYQRDGEITDGTRYFTIRFPENRKSLPYSVRFNVDGEIKHYKVMHNNMKTVCLICSSSDHLARKCPQNKCYSCNLFGHIAQDCPTRICYGCGALNKWCDCAEINAYRKQNNTQKEEEARKQTEQKTGKNDAILENSMSQSGIDIEKETACDTDDKDEDENISEDNDDNDDDNDASNDGVDENNSMSENKIPSEREIVEESEKAKECIWGNFFDLLKENNAVSKDIVTVTPTENTGTTEGEINQQRVQEKQIDTTKPVSEKTEQTTVLLKQSDKPEVRKTKPLDKDEIHRAEKTKENKDGQKREIISEKQQQKKSQELGKAENISTNEQEHPMDLSGADNPLKRVCTDEDSDTSQQGDNQRKKGKNKRRGKKK